VQLGATISGLQWIVDGYSLIFASFLLTAGMLGDRLGNKRMFLLGLGLFTLASTLCGFAPNLLSLQVCRLVQGLGAALQVPASLALISHTYTQRAERARAIGTWGAVGGMGAALGPVFGGFLVNALGWRSVFLINIPIGLLAVGLTLKYVLRPPRLQQHGLDIPAQVLAIAGLTGITFALIEGPAQGWLAAPIPGGFVLFALSGTLFLWRERRTENPMLPLTLFGHPQFSAGNVIGLLVSFGFYGQLFLINLYFAHVQGFSALLTGLAILPESLMVLIGSKVGGLLTSRRGPRLPIASGMLLGSLGLAGLSIAQMHTMYLLLLPSLMATGIGTSLTVSSMTAMVIESAPGERPGTASAVLNTFRQVGQVLGIALLGSFVTGHTASISGQQIALWLGSAAFLLGCIIAVIYTRPHQPQKS
ncbi:MAG TPA: MFS transporter, partial [Ktedonobacteraceae bacterium]|nr:MFS transporter [Ktedonobacteraceae bacterium]